MNSNNYNILDIETLERAYENLSLDDQIAIDRISSRLIDNFKRRVQDHVVKPMFGRQAALELLANLGILINKTMGEQE